MRVSSTMHARGRMSLALLVAIALVGPARADSVINYGGWGSGGDASGEVAFSGVSRSRTSTASSTRAICPSRPCAT
jgi:hypothetical protein